MMRAYAGPAVAMFPKPKVASYSMKAKTEDAADVYLYDIIGDSWDGTTAKQFANDLKALGVMKTLNIFINSPGGSVFDGVAIYNVLQRHEAKKNIHIDGIAASIASVVAMVGDTITIAKNGMMMIHDPWAFAMGTAEDMRKAADSLDKIKDVIIQTYVDRTKQKSEDVATMMSNETWFTADEAVAAGFADEVSDKEVEMAAMSVHNLSQFRNLPQQLRQVEKTEEPSPALVPNVSVVKAAARLAYRRLGQPDAK